MALFGEKYIKQVRVVSTEDFSMEFMVSAHVENTSYASYLKLQESPVWPPELEELKLLQALVFSTSSRTPMPVTLSILL